VNLQRRLIQQFALVFVVANVTTTVRIKADIVAFAEPSYPRIGYLQTSGGSPNYLTTYPTFSPNFLAYDSVGNLYSTQAGMSGGNSSIYKVTPSGAKSVFANVSGATSLEGLAYDRANNVLYAAAYSDGLIARITMDGAASTFVSGVPNPFQLAVDSSGNVFSSNLAAGTISKITPSGTVSTFASGFYQPASLTIDASDTLVVKGSYYFWKITPDGTKTSWLPINPRESNPQQIAFDSTGNLWVADADNYSIWKVDSAGTKTTVLDTSYFSNRGIAVYAPVPEPSTYAMALAGLGCGGYSLFRRRRAR